VYSTWAKGCDARRLWRRHGLLHDRRHLDVDAGGVWISALLVQRYRQHYGGANPSPDIVKGLLINTAHDLGRPGPDYLFGYGMADALASVADY